MRLPRGRSAAATVEPAADITHGMEEAAVEPTADIIRCPPVVVPRQRARQQIISAAVVYGGCTNASPLRYIHCKH